MRRNCTEPSPISIAHSHLLRVLGSSRAANPNQPVVQLRFQRCTWQTWGFFRLCGCPEHKNAGKYEYIGMCMRENGTVCPFAFFPRFVVFFASIGKFPFKTCFWSVEGYNGCRKGQTVSLGRTHQLPKCLQNKGKTNKTIIGLITGVGLKLDKNCFYTGKNAKRTNGSIFICNHSLEVPASKKCWRCEVAKAHKSWTFDIFELQKRLGSWTLLSSRGTKNLEFFMGVHEAQSCTKFNEC